MMEAQPAATPRDRRRQKRTHPPVSPTRNGRSAAESVEGDELRESSHVAGGCASKPPRLDESLAVVLRASLRDGASAACVILLTRGRPGFQVKPPRCLPTARRAAQSP